MTERSASIRVLDHEYLHWTCVAEAGLHQFPAPVLTMRGVSIPCACIPDLAMQWSSLSIHIRACVLLPRNVLYQCRCWIMYCIVMVSIYILESVL